MDREQEKRVLQQKLDRYRRFAVQYSEGETAKHLEALIADLEQKIRALEQE